MKDKLWKDYWDLDLGCSYIPVDKVTTQVNYLGVPSSYVEY